MNTKPSEVFEGPESSLRKAFDDATDQDVIEKALHAIETLYLGMIDPSAELHEKARAILTTLHKGKAVAEVVNQLLNKIDGYKVIDGVSFDGPLPPADHFTKMVDDTNMIRAHVNGILDMLAEDIKTFRP